MASKLNAAAVAKCRQLIQEGKVDRGLAFALGLVESAAPEIDASMLLGESGGAFGKEGKVYRAALIQARHQAIGMQDLEAFAAIGRLLALVDGGAEGKVSVRALAADTTEITVYGPIGELWDGTGNTALDFLEAIRAVTTPKVTIHLNSIGGAVDDGLAIVNAMRGSSADITLVVDAVAASVAAQFLAGADRAQIYPNGLVMIHAPWGGAVGNARAMRDAADMMDKYALAMAQDLVAKTGKPLADVMAWLNGDQDNWFTAQEALAAGLVDEIIDADAPAQAAAAPKDVSRYMARAPTRIAAMLRDPTQSRMEDRVMPKTKAELESDAIEAERVAAEATAKAVAARQAAGGPGATVDEQKVISLFAERVKLRNTAIKAQLKPFLDVKGIVELQAEALEDPLMTAETVQAKCMEILGKAGSPATPAGGGRTEMGETEGEKFVKGASLAIGVRAQLITKRDEVKKALDGNEFRSYAMLELARVACERGGINTRGLNKLQVVAAAFESTSDFPNLLQNIAHNALMQGYLEADETFPAFTKPGTLTDFRPAARSAMGEFDTLKQVNPGADYTYGSIGDRGESIVLATYGKLFGINREAIINDDLDAFAGIPRKMGRAAPRTIGNLVFAILTGNPNMADGVALFHANHHNLAGTATGITTASVDAMRVAMAGQVDRDKKVTALNIKLNKLIVPIALGGQARTVRDSAYQVDAITSAKGSQNTIPNSVKGLFDVVEDARLDAFDSLIWFGTADPGITDTIEVAYLDGQQEPYMEQHMPFHKDGVEFKVRLDAGVKALAWEGLAKNAGH